MYKNIRRSGGKLLLILLALSIVAGGSIIWRKASGNGDTLRFFSGLGVGWNLGNTLDAHGLPDGAQLSEYETYWNNPITTREMFMEIRAAGFRTVRVPMTWLDHMDEQYKVDAEWMRRVTQVVDDALSCDLYVIINAHHDNWYVPTKENLPGAEKVMRSLWGQIADNFSGYGDTLLFEGMNEPRLIGTEHEWTDGTIEARNATNILNGVFVATVRASSGCNKNRYLLLPTYCASTDPSALADFRLPDDSKLAVSVHLYKPYGFTMSRDGTKDWDASNQNDTMEVKQIFDDLRRYFIKEGVPVVITEFGTIDKNNEPARANWTEYILTEASKLDIVCVWWDNGSPKPEEAYSLFDRRTLKWLWPGILEKLVAS